ncbi:heme peroxidase [Mucidula mucida]|nr:heme peroxidase [Mucidula mucida]
MSTSLGSVPPYVVSTSCRFETEMKSHSVAAQDGVDPVRNVYRSVPGSPFDSTPDTFDSQFYVETLLKGTAFPGDGRDAGGVESPLAGEFRLTSDFELARDKRTSCEWQTQIADHNKMMNNFKKAMAKMAILGHDRKDLIDCSEVIPVPARFSLPRPHLPAGRTIGDIESSCATATFPSLSADPGVYQGWRSRLTHLSDSQGKRQAYHQFHLPEFNRRYLSTCVTTSLTLIHLTGTI